MSEEAKKEEAPTITYKRPSGSEITCTDNEANRQLAAAEGWEEVKGKK